MHVLLLTTQTPRHTHTHACCLLPSFLPIGEKETVIGGGGGGARKKQQVQEGHVKPSLEARNLSFECNYTQR